MLFYRWTNILVIWLEAIWTSTLMKSGVYIIKWRTAIDQYSSLLYLRIGLVSDPMWSIDLSAPTTGYSAS